MYLGRHRRRMAGVAALAVAAVLAVGCSSSGAPPSSGGGKPVKGGTATMSLSSPGVTLSWIFPFYAITNSSVYNSEQFQWLMYRPLYMFGNNTNDNVAINYPLSPANQPVYSNGGKTVVVNMKGWKWSDGSTVDAKSVIFYMNMVEAEKANWYATTPGLLPDNVTSYKATGPNQVTFQLNKAYSSIWFTYNQLAELTPMPEAWDVTSLSAAPGSGGCATDSAADGWAKCKAVYTFMTAQSKQSATYATSKLWQVVDGPWKLSAYNSDGHVTFVPNPKYSGSPKPQLAAVKIVPFTDDSTEYTALKTGQIDVGYIPAAGPAAEAGELGPAGDQPAGQRLQPAAVLLVRHLLRPAQLQQPDRGLHGPAALHAAGPADGLRPARHRQGDLPRVRRPELGAVPEHAAQQPVATCRPEARTTFRARTRSARPRRSRC